MTQVRVEEQFAAACVEAAISGVAVHVHDGNGRTSAHDFDLMNGSEPVAAMEVTTATDGDANIIEKQLVQSGPFRFEDLSSNWIVSVRLGAPTRPLLDQAHEVLAELESAGIEVFDTDRSDHGYRELSARARHLGIETANALRHGGVGRVRFTPAYPIDRSAGFMRPDGNALAEWVGDWLREPARADNLGKLRRSGRGERHMFVLLPMLPTAPFEVFNVFLDGVPPNRDPALPEEVTHVWAASNLNHPGWRWNAADGWSAFAPQSGPYSTPPDCACP